MSALKLYHQDRHDAEAEAVAQILSLPEGRRFVRCILRQAGVEGVPWGANAAVTSKEIGRLELGRELDALCLLHAPDYWEQMHAEHRAERIQMAELEALERK